MRLRLLLVGLIAAALLLAAIGIVLDLGSAIGSRVGPSPKKGTQSA